MLQVKSANQIKMLNKLPYARQSGVVLFIALISLLVMSLASVALIRSVNTNTDITGNLGFKRAATASADAGTEVATAWLKANITGTALESDISAKGYFASAPSGGASDTGSTFWANNSASGVCNLPINAGSCSNAETYDAAGNAVSFMVQRLCKTTGDNQAASCARDPAVTAEGSDQSSDVKLLTPSTATYYRVVVRVRGPHNTVSYVQTIVSL